MSRGRWMSDRQRAWLWRRHSTLQALRWVLSVLATRTCLSLCTFIAFSWVSHVLCLRESRTLMEDKGTNMVLRRSARSGEHPDFLSAMKDR